MSHSRIAKLTRSLKEAGATKIGGWIITADGIKRKYTTKDGKLSWQRLPRDLYADLDLVGQRDLLDRLNAENWRLRAALEKYQIQSAFIPPNTLSEFEKKLLKESNPQTAKSRMQNLREYCLEFFIPRSPNPIAWQKDLQAEWVDYLVSLDYSPSTYKHIKTSLNKFMRFLATKNQDLPVLQFDGLTPYQVAEIRFQRELKGLGVRRFIPENEFNTILKAASPQLQPYCQIAYGYGLRRNEIRALPKISDCVKVGYLEITRQLKGSKLAMPKYRKPRKVPHWFMTVKNLEKLIAKLQPYLDWELSEEFSELTRGLYEKGEISAPYVLHDCRHSFVSRAADLYDIHQVMFAAGHSDLRTTSTYLKDTKKRDSETYKPRSAS